MPSRAYGFAGSGGIAYPERADERDNWVTEAIHRAGCWLATRSRPHRRPVGVVVRRANRAEPVMSALDDGALRERARSAGARMRVHGINGDDVAQILAATREAATRTLSMRPHDVQLLGAWTLVQGHIAEMETGEGKTLTASLAGVCVALTGVPVHVITVNEYLCSRDAERLAPLYAFFGLRVGLITQDMTPDARRDAYAQPIVYCTNSELAFDYLKDRIALGQCRSALQFQMSRIKDRGAYPVVLNGLHYVIVDEIDSILADEARTPLIISGSDDSSSATEAGDEGYLQALALAGDMARDVHFRISAGNRALRLSDAGSELLEHQAADLGPIWQSRRRREELVTQALTALHLFNRDQHYVVNDDKVQIVDEYTGRIFPDRAWEQGLHQLIELKERVPTSARRASLARISYQQFFRRYLKVSGMSGTVSEIAGELRWVYRLKIRRIPTNRPLRRRFLGTRICASEREKHERVLARVREMMVAGRPVLLGTRSIGASNRLSVWLSNNGIAHQVLNARQDEEEANIIAGAGDTGCVTVATNMAGRGTDILLSEQARKAGGLHVIATERHESARIDRQLFGRAGRQGDPGSGEEILALDDELWLIFTPRMLHALLRSAARYGGAFGRRIAALSFNAAQMRAERTHAKTRRQLVKSDRQLNDALAFAGNSE